MLPLVLYARRPWSVWAEPAGRCEAPGASPAAAPASRAGAFGILREFLGAVELPSDAASARALWTRPSPVAERIGLASVDARAPGGELRMVE